MNRFFISSTNHLISNLTAKLLSAINDIADAFDQAFDEPATDIVKTLENFVDGKAGPHDDWLSNKIKQISSTLGQSEEDMRQAIKKVFDIDPLKDFKVLLTPVGQLTTAELEQDQAQKDKINLPLIDSGKTRSLNDPSNTLSFNFAAQLSYQVEALRLSTLLKTPQPDDGSSLVEDYPLVGLGFDGRLSGKLDGQFPFGTFGFGVQGSKRVEIDYYYQTDEHTPYIQALSSNMDDVPALTDLAAVKASFDRGLRRIAYDIKGNLQLDAKVSVGKLILGRAIKANAGLIIAASATVDSEFEILIEKKVEQGAEQSADNRLIVSLNQKKVNGKTGGITLGVDIDVSDKAKKYHDMVADAMPEASVLKEYLGEFLDLGTQLKTKINDKIGTEITVILGQSQADKLTSRLEDLLNTKANVLASNIQGFVDSEVFAEIANWPIDETKKTEYSKQVATLLAQQKIAAQSKITAIADDIDKTNQLSEKLIDQYQQIRCKILTKLEQAVNNKAQLSVYGEFEQQTASSAYVKVALDCRQPDAQKVYQMILNGDVRPLFSQTFAGVEVLGGLLKTWQDRQHKSGISLAFIGFTAGSETLLSSSSSISLDSNGNLVVATKGSVVRSSHFNKKRYTASFFDVMGLVALQNNDNVPLSMVLSASNEAAKPSDIARFFDKAVQHQLMRPQTMTQFQQLQDSWRDNNKKTVNAQWSLSFNLNREEFDTLLKADELTVRKAVIAEYIDKGYYSTAEFLREAPDLLGGVKMTATTEMDDTLASLLVAAADFNQDDNESIIKQMARTGSTRRQAKMQTFNRLADRRSYAATGHRIYNITHDANDIATIIAMLRALFEFIQTVTSTASDSRVVDTLNDKQDAINHKVKAFLDTPNWFSAFLAFINSRNDDIMRQPMVLIGTIAKLVNRQGPAMVAVVKLDNEEEQSLLG